MNWWVILAVAVLVALGYLAYRLGWIDLSDKTRKRSSSSGSSIVGIGDEVFAPTRHEAQIELDRQSFLPAPAPLAGDGDNGIFDGRIIINVAQSGQRLDVRHDLDAPPRAGGRHVSESRDPDSPDA